MPAGFRPTARTTVPRDIVVLGTTSVVNFGSRTHMDKLNRRNSSLFASDGLWCNDLLALVQCMQNMAGPKNTWQAKRYHNNMYKTLHTVHVVYTRMQTAMNIFQNT